MSKGLGVFSAGMVAAGLVLGQGPPAPPAPPAAPRLVDERVQVFRGTGSYLGVGVEEIDSARAKELKLPEARGVEIRRVDPGSAADKAGLREHDVVLEYNGQRVEGTEQFARLVRETPVGHTAKLVISRDGNTQTIAATIGRRRSSEGQVWSFNMPAIPPIPPMPSIEIPQHLMVLRTSRIGVSTETLSGQLADYFGVKEGVLVRSVEKDSPAEKAGLKAGDVIVKVDGEKVSEARDLSDQLRNSRDKKSIPLRVVRGKREITLTLEMPERAQGWGGGHVVRFEQERL